MKLATAEGIDLRSVDEGQQPPLFWRMTGFFGGRKTAGPKDFSQTRFSEQGLSDVLEAFNDQLERFELQATEESIRRISRFEKDWDGQGSEAPQQAAVAYALTIIPQLYRAAVSVAPWVRPHVSASEEGEITFEWWSGDHKVTMYIGDNRIEYLRVWGADIDDDMDSGELELPLFSELWKWLQN